MAATSFLETATAPLDHWRSIVLLGRNVQSYKFALAKTLLGVSERAGTVVRIEYIAGPFSRHLCEHLRRCDKQGTPRSSKFLDGLRKHNAGSMDWEAVVAHTMRLGFQNVIDAFHNLPGGESPTRFFVDRRDRGGDGGIEVTGALPELMQTIQGESLLEEAESRWRLVETAWELGLPRQALVVDFDPDDEVLLARGHRRPPITPCAPALNGYQKGRCFHCCKEISIDSGHPARADVDHFFPHVLKGAGLAGLDGIWNLVLACQSCNRGEGGKFGRVPTIALLERLNTRNNFLIESHHPLRETLMGQSGHTEQLRRGFLQRYHVEAVRALIHTWEPADGDEPTF